MLLCSSCLSLLIRNGPGKIWYFNNGELLQLHFHFQKHDLIASKHPSVWQAFSFAQEEHPSIFSTKCTLQTHAIGETTPVPVSEASL